MNNKETTDNYIRSLIDERVDYWNDWRKKNPFALPDLSGAILRSTNLSEVNFSKLNLISADLSGSNLTNANLDSANLKGVDLNGANLKSAILTNTNLTNANLKKSSLFNSNLSKADLHYADLGEANLSGANLSGAILQNANLNEAILHNSILINANLTGAKFYRARLSKANLAKADLSGANLLEAKLRKANLRAATLDKTILSGSDLSETDLGGAKLIDVDLNRARMIKVKLNKATITGCIVFGISAWKVSGLETAEQSNLIITPKKEPTITVDNLEVAQFIYLLLNNRKLRSVIDSITSKVVLILGRFTPKRKAILDDLRRELRSRNYLPVLFDFEKPKSRNMTETIRTLAGMARFVIADITEAKSIIQELQAIVPHNPSVPIQPIIQSSNFEWGMFDDLKDYPWVLEVYVYEDVNNLLKSLKEKVIAPAENKTEEIRERRLMFFSKKRTTN